MKFPEFVTRTQEGQDVKRQNIARNNHYSAPRMSSSSAQAATESIYEGVAREILEIINLNFSFELSAVTRIVKRTGIDRSPKHFPQLIYFLYIKKHFDQNAAPSSLVDELWKAVLLMPKLYATICLLIDGRKVHELTMGVLIDRDPYSHEYESDRKRRYARTLRLLKECFPSQSNDEIAWPHTPMPAEPVQTIAGAAHCNESAAESLSATDDQPATKKQRIETSEEAAVPNKLKIYIRELNGRNTAFEFDANTTTLHVKEVMLQKYGFPVCQQRLVWQGIDLDDEDTLGEYNITTGATIYQLLNLRGC